MRATPAFLLSGSPMVVLLLPSKPCHPAILAELIANSPVRATAPRPYPLRFMSPPVSPARSVGSPSLSFSSTPLPLTAPARHLPGRSSTSPPETAPSVVLDQLVEKVRCIPLHPPPAASIVTVITTLPP